MSYEQQFLVALGLTVTSELVAAFIFQALMKKRPVEISPGRLVIAVILASALTLPYLWFIWPYFLRDSWSYILVGEAWVVMIEAFWYCFVLSFSWKRALIFSFILNLFSVIVGKILW